MTTSAVTASSLRYTYHHGFYDGLEHEFRGFGRVDQLDTEEIAPLTGSGHFPAGEQVDAASDVPPVLRRPGSTPACIFGRGTRLAASRTSITGRGCPATVTPLSSNEARAMRLEDINLPARLTPEEAREACRSLKGSTCGRSLRARRTGGVGRPYWSPKAT